jgi:hypothetical protein
MSSFKQGKPSYGQYSTYEMAENNHFQDYNLEDLRPTPPPKPADTMHSVHEIKPSWVSVVKDSDELDNPYKSGSSGGFKRVAFHALRIILVAGIIAVLLAIPTIVLQDFADVSGSTDDTLQNKNAVYWIFIWLLFTWVAGSVSHVLALMLPYIFWIIAKFVNPAHRKCKSFFHMFRGRQISHFRAYLEPLEHI